jgi:hypothetical protein
MYLIYNNTIINIDKFFVDNKERKILMITHNDLYKTDLCIMLPNNKYNKEQKKINFYIYDDNKNSLIYFNGSLIIKTDIIPVDIIYYYTLLADYYTYIMDDNKILKQKQKIRILKIKEFKK